MKRKTTVRIFQETNWQNHTRDGLDKVYKGKLTERNKISTNNSTKERHKDQLFQSKNK